MNSNAVVWVRGSRNGEQSMSESSFQSRLAMPTRGVVRNGGVRVEDGQPFQDDEFKVSGHLRATDHEWSPDPLDALLRMGGDQPLRTIPIKLAFDDLNLTMTHRFTSFAEGGEIRCSSGSDGQAYRHEETSAGLQVLACNGPAACDFARARGCSMQSSFAFHIEGQEEADLPFVLRSASEHMSDIRGYLAYLRGMLGGQLAGVPLELTLEERQSPGTVDATYLHPSLRPRFSSYMEMVRKLRCQREVEQSFGVQRSAAEAALLEHQGSSLAASFLGREVLVGGPPVTKAAPVRAEAGSALCEVNKLISELGSLEPRVEDTAAPVAAYEDAQQESADGHSSHVHPVVIPQRANLPAPSAAPVPHVPVGGGGRSGQAIRSLHPLVPRRSLLSSDCRATRVGGQTP